MYQVTIDLPEKDGYVQRLLHTVKPHSTQRLASGTIVEEVGQIPSFSFTVTPVNHCYYDCLLDRRTLVSVMNIKTMEMEFEGVILNTEERMTASGKLLRKVVCEGFLGYLCDSVQMYRTYEDMEPAQFLQSLLEQHNAQMPEHKQIRLGVCNLSGNTNSKTTAYRNTLEEIRENLVNRLGGELRVRRKDGILYLDYLDAVTDSTPSPTTIELAQNMKTMTAGTDSLSVITRLIPLGAQVNEETAERLTIAGAKVDGKSYGKVYIDDEAAIAEYGYIVGTVEFDDITVPENLYERGRAYLAENNRIRKYYEATVLDLSTLDSSVGSIRAGNTYRFRNRFMKLDAQLRLLRRTVDIFKPYTPSVVIGDRTEKLTDMTSRQNRLIEYEIPKIKSDTVSAAKAIASGLITAATTGYVVIRPDEILIMDTADTKTATSVWRFNANGLGYSHSDVPGEAYNGTYGLAMTMNGEIVADFIAAGSMYADRIRGGTLVIGGSDGKDGVIQVKDDAGNVICQLDKNGANIFGTVITRNDAGYWMQLDSGSLLGGNGNDTYTTINATGTIRDLDHDITYHGLLVDADAVYLDCKMFAINGATGATGTMYALGGSGEVVTDVWIDEEGNLQKSTVQASPVYFRNGIMCTGL
ncbi:MAG: hypothetical protein E7511_03020 [Ruminococcus sp.]|nr:hypothetical protein [Ruminococcus sp.]